MLARLRALVGRILDRRLRRLLADSSWMMASTAASAVLGIVQVLVVTRFLGATLYGKLVLILGVATAVRQFVGVRIWEWAMKEFAVAYTKKDAVHAAQVVELGYGVGAAVNLISFGIVIAVSGICARRIVHDESTSGLIILYGLVLLVNWSYDTSFAVLRVAGKFRFLAVQQLVSSVLRIIVLGGAVLVWRRLDTTVEAYLAIEVAVSLWLLVASEQVFKRELGGRWWRLARGTKAHFAADMRRLMAIGSIIDTLKMAATRLDLMVLGWFWTPDVVGNYQAASNFIDTVNKLAQPITMVTFSDLAKLGANGQGKEVLRLVRKLTLIGLAITLPMCAALALGAPLWCRVVYGAGYPGAPAILAVLGWTLLWHASMWMFPSFVSLGKAQWGLQLFLWITPLKLLLLALLVPHFGGVGLALAHLAYCVAIPLSTPLFLARMKRWVGSTEYAALHPGVA